MLDQLAAAFRRLVDQLGGLLQRRLVLEARDQRFGGAGDHGQHVVEVVRDAAGQLADGVQFLRLLQLAFGFARGGDVVVDQRRAADGARGVAQRAAADHEMQRRAAVGGADDDFLFVERFAAQRPRRRQLFRRQRRDAVGVIDGARAPQLLDRHARPVAQHLLCGRVGEQDVSLGVDDEHRLRHAVKGALQHRGRMPDFRHGRRPDARCARRPPPPAPRWWLWWRSASPATRARAAGRHREHGGEDQDQRDAGEVDRQQDTSVGLGFGAAGRQAACALPPRPFRGCRRSRRSPRDLPGRQRGNAGVVARHSAAGSVRLAGNLALHHRLGLFDQRRSPALSLTVSISYRRPAGSHRWRRDIPWRIPDRR